MSTDVVVDGFDLGLQCLQGHRGAGIGPMLVTGGAAVVAVDLPASSVLGRCHCGSAVGTVQDAAHRMYAGSF
jgi:hypothetical protein